MKFERKNAIGWQTGAAAAPEWADSVASAPPGDRRLNSMPGEIPGWDEGKSAVLVPFARRFIWWQAPEEAVRHPRRVIAQVMNLGLDEDVEALVELVGPDVLRDVLAHAEPGWFEHGPRGNADRWVAWHRRLGLGDAPPRPRRTIAPPYAFGTRTMRIHFLDDARLRHDVFARAHGADDVVHVFTAPEAIRALDERPRFDLVHLDHDLAEEHYLEVSQGLRETPVPGDTPFDVGTGMEVVLHIVAMAPERRPGQVVVHSHNAIAVEMVARLERAGVPASWARFE